MFSPDLEHGFLTIGAVAALLGQVFPLAFFDLGLGEDVAAAQGFGDEFRIRVLAPRVEAVVHVEWWNEDHDLKIPSHLFRWGRHAVGLLREVTFRRNGVTAAERVVPTPPKNMQL